MRIAANAQAVLVRAAVDLVLSPRALNLPSAVPPRSRNH
jgi:hypothetical protein